MDYKSPNAFFINEVLARRLEYRKRRQETNLFPPRGRPILEQMSESDSGPVPSETFWIEDGTPFGQCVRIYDVPGTLSGEILRLRQPMPQYDGHFQVHGDDITPLDSSIPLPEDEYIDDSEDTSEPLSTRIIQLLGKSTSGELVFEKYLTRYKVGRFCSIAIYKRWVLDIIEALKCLHSIGIIHKDLRVDNLLWSVDGQRAIVCDLESRWGQRQAPEVSQNRGLDAGWTAKSDIYDLGDCIKGMVYNNAPITRQVEWPVPPPFESIVEACMRTNPKDRPTLDELQVLVEAIDDGDEVQS
ncbi:hypothetical protein BU24DRAFT_488419 [Aaosphaeria arxii CBS 175.79]|uniref:Kinase-like protein n=1 Tax=Aaosphaeria arxii CBS 175.79 TaxID=1450172 RepID=A0A6A5YA95_9PLEO|nr:uncharacterized protein BU24DRAFT_488419 [Aaosphaeria arxii CBS 175.79]KAF2022143.1 hypothetical protein BU24DRAFT_488419 [Aaosphaeria arxii CBS 175.79]